MLKPLIWRGSSRENLKEFPKKVRIGIGYSLYRAQGGEKHKDAKPLKGVAGVMEIASRFDTNTYRAVYYTKIQDESSSCIVSRRNRSME